MPRKNGRDADGLSVSIETPGLREMHRRKFEDDGHRACQIAVRSVRELPLLDVIADATDQDPAHALITGVPDPRQGPVQLANAEYVAGELAKRAGGYDFPLEAGSP